MPVPPRPATQVISRPATLAMSFAVGAVCPIVMAAMSALFETIGPRIIFLTDLLTR